jgi:peptidoglycan/LPS O-acetylase OafA/YrhL
VGSYLRNRVLRILPAYWVILVAAAVVLPAVTVRLSASDLELGRLVSHPSALLSNAVLMQNYFAGSLDTGIGPAWSLAVEVAFYLALPFLAFLAATLAVPAGSRRGRTTAALVPPFVLFGVGLVAASGASALLAPDSLWHSILVRSFLNHADLFAFGMALAVLMVSIEDGVVTLPPWWRKAAFVSFVVSVLTTLILVDRGLILTYRGSVEYETLTAIASVLLLALVVLPSADASVSHLTRLLDTRVLVAIGLASYSMFLWHEPLIRWLQSEGLTFAGRIGFVENLALVCALTAALATLTYRFVERPALAQKRR